MDRTGSKSSEGSSVGTLLREVMDDIDARKKNISDHNGTISTDCTTSEEPIVEKKVFEMKTSTPTSPQKPRSFVSMNYTLLITFFMHGCCSVMLVLLNKSMSTEFTCPFTVVALQNTGTLVGATLLTALGYNEKLRGPKREHIHWLIINSIWMMLVLWCSVKALQFISVPLYVLARNTVPFQTALIERIFSGKILTVVTVCGLMMTFCGTALYTFSEMDIDMDGIFFAFLNTFLVASICVYEGKVMHRCKSYMSVVEVNFFRIVFMYPFILPLAYYEYVTEYEDKSEYFTALQSVILPVTASCVFAFGIGSLLLRLQILTSATTIQLANIVYKFVTTLCSRFTHPTAVAPQAWIGYALCTAGISVYMFADKNIQSPKRKEE